MGYLLWLFLIVWALYAVYIVRFINKLVYKTCKFTETLDPNLKEEYKPFERNDRQKWRMWEMYICGIFLLPGRIVLLVGSIASLCVLAQILGIRNEKESMQEIKGIKRQLVMWGQRMVATCIMISVGYYYQPIINKKIEEFDDSYPTKKYESRNHTPPILVANHTSWVDIFALSQTHLTPGFLSKSDVKNYPFFGVCACMIQCIFVDRENSNERSSVLQKIIQRAKNIVDGKNFPPINIFPEGTTSNGEYLISFKKGAFEPGQPVKIVCLKYDQGNFKPGLDTIPMLPHFIFLACQFRNKLQVTELDTYFPDHLEIKDYEQNWDIYARKVKNVMLKVLQVKNSEAGFRDMKDYEKILKDQKNKIA